MPLAGYLFFLFVNILAMKKICVVFASVLIFSACAPNDSDRSQPLEDGQNRTAQDSANAGLTGTTDANGFIPADSNKTISNLRSAPADTSEATTDSIQKRQ